MLTPAKCGCPILTIYIPMSDSLVEMKVIRFTACQGIEVSRILNELVDYGILEPTQARSSWAAIQLATAHFLDTRQQ